MDINKTQHCETSFFIQILVKFHVKSNSTTVEFTESILRYKAEEFVCFTERANLRYLLYLVVLYGTGNYRSGFKNYFNVR